MVDPWLFDPHAQVVASPSHSAPGTVTRMCRDPLRLLTRSRGTTSRRGSGARLEPRGRARPRPLGRGVPNRSRDITRRGASRFNFDSAEKESQGHSPKVPCSAKAHRHAHNRSARALPHGCRHCAGWSADGSGTEIFTAFRAERARTMTRRLTGRSGLHGAHARCHSTSTRSWHCGVAASGPACAWMRLVGPRVVTPFGVANATEFGYEVVGCHERAHEIREDLKGDVWARMKFNMRS